MLEFSPNLSESKYLQHCLFPKVPASKIDWPIFDAKTKLKLDKIEQKKIIQHTTRYSNWQWPDKQIYFISDIHADANAMIASLILSGTIKKTGMKSSDFILTKKSKKSRIIIGGDCLDKGPSNLNLLRTLKKLIQLKENTILLAGNHDLRLYMGLKCLRQKDNISSSHFFIRMGKKVLPLLNEVYNEYLHNTKEILNPPSIEFCRQELYPSARWQKKFVEKNEEQLTHKTLQLELKKIHKKWTNFESDCLEHGLSLIMIYQAIQKCYSLFLEPDGEFYWFFNKMKLIHQEKSFLFTHAGLDNKITKILKKSRVEDVNNFYKTLLNGDLCQFYYGTIANLLRTKYRKTDPVLSHKGVTNMHRLGVHAIVHGHVSQSSGQNIILRSGMLHFECDVTLDKNSRLKAGLSEFGAGVTSISPKGIIEGISTDSPQIKLFKPEL